MHRQTTITEWPVLGRDDPPLDIEREEAAFACERDRLVRDHCGKLALIHDDEVVGVFDNVDDAIHEAVSRFGLTKVVIKEISASDAAEHISHVDINHPSFKRLS